MQTGDEHIDFDLLTKYLVGETTAAESAAVQVWLADSERNRAVLDELRQVMDAADAAKPEVMVNTDAAWANMQQKMKQKSGGKVIHMPAPDTGSKWRLAALAAILVGVILVAAVLFTNAPNTEDAGMALVRTAAETRTDTLPDGTIITLNKNSTIIYPEAFAGHERRVVLTGEAFFEVTKDAARPFIIDVGEVDVTVLGTSFNVAAYPSSTDIVVVVETGKVKVSDGKENEVLLTPGEMGTYNKASKELIRSVNDDIDYQFWRLKKLVFANTRLEEVVDVLNRQYEAKLSLEDDAAGACRFTATFQDDSLQTILNVLTATFKMELEDGPQGRVLKGKACDGSSL